jgi:GntR family transcriptional regulator/MocR family aminotransferase
MVSTRGLNCTEDQVLIVSGTQQAITLAAQVLLNPGDEVWLDEPGYDGARGAFLAAGTVVRPVGGDQEGMDVSMGIRLWPRARLAFTAPSHQFPLGGTMSLSRRLALLEWAEARRMWIFEDDYNGEFRYTGRPVQALQGLDRHQRVIYAGTFSKMMYPGLRLGFLVVPSGLMQPFVTAKHYADARSSFLEQAVLAEFIEGGHYARHVRRVRRACAQRQKALVEALLTHLPGKLEIHPTDTGIHLVCWLPRDVDELEFVERCRRSDLQVQPLSRYSMTPLDRRGILLGYAAHTPDDLQAAVKRLARLV